MSAGPAAGDLSGITVALLRSPDRGAAMAASLAERGAEVLMAPLIDWELPSDTGELDRLLGAASSYDWLVITSVNTVRVLAQRAEALSVSLTSLIGSISVAAVGTATRSALIALGVRVDLMPREDQSAEGLLAELQSGPARALIPQSDLAADTLRAGLTERGWNVDAVTAYVTVDYPADAARRVVDRDGYFTPGPGVLTRTELWDALQEGRIDAVVLSSPSIAARLRAMMGTLPDTVATVAIGRRTERDASALGIRVDVTAAAPTPPAIADAVSTAVVNHRKRT